MSTLFICLYMLLAICAGAILYGAIGKSKSTVLLGFLFLIVLLLVLLAIYMSNGAVLLGAREALDML